MTENEQKNIDLQSKQLDEIYEKEKNTIFGFFIRRYRITYLIMILIFVFGFYALFTLPKEAEPEIKIPYAIVNTAYQGANPADVEELVTNKIEQKIENVDNVKTYNSSSRTGLSSVFVEFEAEADIDKSIQDLKDAVDMAKPNLPNDASDPYVSQMNINNMPIVTYSLIGDYTDEELKHYADIVQDKLEAVKDVSDVPIIGGLEREFQVNIDQVKLANYNLSISQLIGAISRNNLNIPSGNIEIDDFKYNVRVQSGLENIDDLYNTFVAYSNDSPIYLRDVAEIKDTFKDKTTISRIGLPNENAKNTISLQIYKKTGGNILKMVENTDKTIAELNESGELGEGIYIKKTNDNAEFIRDDVRTLGSSGLQTMILIVLFLFAVLGLRGAIITGFSVPIAFLISFIFIMFQGMTINSMVLFSLVLSLGLMVDNSIIIMEGITEYMHHYGKSVLEASILSVWNYKWAIISGTMTSVGAFLPMLLVSGIMGEYMGILPKTITATLVSSLFVALVIIPTLVSRFYKVKNGNNQDNTNLESSNNGKKKHKHLGLMAKFLPKLKDFYHDFMNKVLVSKKRRAMAIVLAVLLFVMTVLLPVVGVMKIEMFPSMDIDYFVINIELPVGASLNKTTEVVTKAEEVVKQIPDLDNYVTTIGGSFSLMSGGSGGSGTNLGSIVVNLKKQEQGRERKSYEITEDIRDDIESIQGGELKVEELTGGPPTGAPVEARIFGPDLDKLSIISEEIVGILENIQGTVNVSDSLEESTGEITFKLNKQKIAFFGLDAMTVGSTVRQALYGVDASFVTINGDDIDIVVKYDKNQLTTVDDIKNLIILTPRGQQILLSQVAEISLEPSVLGIGHRNGDTLLTVTSMIEKDANLQLILEEFEQKKSEIELPKGYTISVGGETEDIQKSFTEIFASMFVAIFLISFILVLQFASFKQPFIILFSLPLAFIGAFVGLTIIGLPFSLPAFIGIVALTGIVVNDSIVLIDRINKNLKRGMQFIDGIVEAGIARMQPIFLTSATTIAGIFPLTYASEMWAGLSWAVIWGLLFSTVLTLVFIPILYSIICRKDFEKGELFN